MHNSLLYNSLCLKKFQPFGLLCSVYALLQTVHTVKMKLRVFLLESSNFGLYEGKQIEVISREKGSVATYLRHV